MHLTIRVAPETAAWLKAQQNGKPNIGQIVDRLVQENNTMSFTTINDVYAEFESYFGSEPCEWTRDQLQDWLQGNGYTRYEDIDAAILDAAYAACIAEITDPA